MGGRNGLPVRWRCRGLGRGLVLLNMVDTPGHVNFGMEVSKSLDGVEGTVMLFDSAVPPLNEFVIKIS